MAPRLYPPTQSLTSPGSPLRLDLGEVGFQGGVHRRHGGGEAVVGVGGTGVQVAGPLAAVAAAPQHQRHEGALLAVVVEALAGQRVADEIPPALPVSMS